MHNPAPAPSLLRSARSLAGRAGLDGFLLALIGMIGLAYVWPEPGVRQGPFALDRIANVGVSVIFFAYGLRLSTDKLRAGLSNWRLHLVVHGATFLLFPLLVLGARALFLTPDTALLWLGAFYVAALPSTVSSSVVMVSIAGGNIPAAIFNASISSLIGIFLTPLWMSLLLSRTSGEYELGPIIGKLVVQVLVPVVLGLLLNRRYGALAERHKAALRTFDQAVILLIVYTSFAESFTQNQFAGISGLSLLTLGGLMLALFALVYGLLDALSRGLHFSRADRITALFCGSKKSLVQGSVMANVLFSGTEGVGVILLPIMLYHALQLIAASVLAQRMARNGGSRSGVTRNGGSRSSVARVVSMEARTVSGRMPVSGGVGFSRIVSECDCRCVTSTDSPW